MKYLIVFLLIGILGHIQASTHNARSDDSDGTSKETSEERSHGKSLRKNFSDRSDRSDDKSDEKSDSEDERESKPEKSLVIGINTGETGKKSEGVDKLIKALKDVVAKMNTGPLFRSKKFEFGDSEKKRSKSSVGVELDTPTLLNFVKKVISSHKFKKATDQVAKKAAVIFRALQDSNE